MYQRLRLLASIAVFVPCVASAQVASLVTHKDVPACRTIEDGRLLAQAMQLRQVDTFKILLDSGRCTIWEKGTTIYLDQSVEGCGGLARIRGICEAVYAYTDKRNPDVFIAPLDEAWTRRKLPAASSEALRGMVALLQEPKDRVAEAKDGTDAAVPLPRRRPGPKAKEKAGGPSLADRLAKLFRPMPRGATLSSYAAPQ